VKLPYLTEGVSVGNSAQTLRCLQLADAPAEYGVFIIYLLFATETEDVFYRTYSIIIIIYIQSNPRAHNTLYTKVW
jgi:hypothetical protein